MIRTVLVAAALALPVASVSAAAGEWDGSLSYTIGGAKGAWSASLKDGRGTAIIGGTEVKVVRKGNDIRLSGNGIRGSGTIKNGKVNGSFTSKDGPKGTFSGKRN